MLASDLQKMLLDVLAFSCISICLSAVVYGSVERRKKLLDRALSNRSRGLQPATDQEQRELEALERFLSSDIKTICTSFLDRRTQLFIRLMTGLSVAAILLSMIAMAATA